LPILLKSITWNRQISRLARRSISRHAR